MVEVPKEDMATLAASLRCGSVVAAAGCGKTEQIARATQIADGRRLILTHTHAGIDVLRARLKKHKVPSDKFRLDTIAGWCLRYGASFPKRSGLVNVQPQADHEWNAVYEAAARLLGGGAVEGILESSYSGVFVDEYQDCSGLQHQVVKALSETLPVCVFGDPMQAIFDFKGQKPVDWNADVFPVFAKAGELVKPWRWHKVGNTDLADWLAALRAILEGGGSIDLAGRPTCVKWENLPPDPRFRNMKIVEICKRKLGEINGGTLVVIGDAVNINARAAIAKNLAKAGFSNIEPLGCTTLLAAAAKIEGAKDFARLEAAMDFICDCLTGAEQADFLKSVKSRQNGGRLGTAKFGGLIDIGVTFLQSHADEALLELMQGFYGKTDTYCFRREMFYAMRAALRVKCARQSCTIADAIWEVQNRFRHAGRLISNKSIGSTLLVKGLEFDHAVVIHTDNMTREHWYVALTRATKSVTILSPSECLKPAA
jgi:DNA helicase-2/ATP-dependent DNA helicase PcrA